MTTATRPNPLSYLTDQLDELKSQGTHFKLRVLEDEQAPVCTFDGKKVINLASNNYLGLTTHPKLREAALEATRKYGVGSGAVRTIAGTLIEIGQGRLDAEQIPRIFEARDRRLAGPSLPAHGLHLISVEY